MAEANPTPSTPDVNQAKVDRIRAELEQHGADSFVQARLEFFSLGELLRDVGREVAD